MTLYTLTFHLSVAPGDNNPYFGRVKAGFDEDTSNNELQAEYDAWLDAFRRRFDQEVIAIQRRYLQGFLTEEDIRQVFIAGWGGIGKKHQ